MVEGLGFEVPATIISLALHQMHKLSSTMTSECNACMQATFASAEVRAKSLAEMQQADAAEAEKLLQRQQAAEAQYDQGLSKLRATARQLQSLASRVRARPVQCRSHLHTYAQAFWIWLYGMRAPLGLPGLCQLPRDLVTYPCCRYVEHAERLERQQRR